MRTFYSEIDCIHRKVLSMKSNKRSTLNIKRQLGCVYTADFFSGLRITDAVWVALLAARGFSLWEIGLAESVFHIVNLL